MSNDLTIAANLGSQLATYKIREAIRKISSGKRTFFGGGASTSSANSIAAEGAANYSASLNLDDALAALRVAQISLDEIASLNQRLAELGLLQSNNSLLSTEDTASLNKETAAITSAIDNIVSNINNDFNKLNEEKFNYIENVKIIEPLPESLSVSVNQNKSCIKQRKTNSNNNTDYKYNNRTTIAHGKFQFYDDIVEFKHFITFKS